jgi:sugar phosphate isomerase/epimerase
VQEWEKKSARIREAYLKAKAEEPKRFEAKLNLSWSNWGFGMEPLAESVARLERHGITYVELHGNHYGPDLGYQPEETTRILSDHGVAAAGICGMFSADNDLSSNRYHQRQAAIDYIRRELEFGQAVGATYMLVVPGAVGRPEAYDDMEFERSVETLSLVADEFTHAGVAAAVEPIRSAEVSFCHTFEHAKAYIERVNDPGVRHINGDVYHMLVEESHIGETIWKAGEMLTNLHLADTNRCALGEGMLDVDTLMMALYLIGYNRPGCYCTPEPLGPGGDPYPAMYGRPDPDRLEALVATTAQTWREREEAVRTLTS